MIDSQSSKNLNALKFIFCIFIIFLHMHSQMPAMGSMPDTGSFFYNCLQIVRDLVSNFLTKVAVPGFAFVSGYLFFATTEFSLSVYKKKIHKRVFSLVIPYISWVIVVFLGDVFLALLGKENLVTTTEWNFVNVLNIFWGIKSNAAGFCPYNGPMWYIRDLFLGVLATPVIYFFLKIKVLRVVFLLTLFFLWLRPVGLPPHETIFLFFFSLGCFFPIAAIDVFDFCGKLSRNLVWVVMFLFVTFFSVISEFHSVNVPKDLVVKSFVLLFFPLLFCYVKKMTTEKVLKLSKSTFVVYCMHNIILAMLGKITYGMSSFVNLYYYFFLPVFTFAIGNGVYLLLTRMNNPVLNLLFLGKR